MKRRWMNIELEKEVAEKFWQFLRKNGIRYESSACFNLVHFEIYLNDEEAKACDEWLENN